MMVSESGVIAEFAELAFGDGGCSAYEMAVSPRCFSRLVASVRTFG